MKGEGSLGKLAKLVALLGGGLLCGAFVSKLMAHKIAKLLLEQADSFLDRTEAVKTALRLGMPLHEIEAYLDWLEASGLQQGKKADEVDPNTGGAGHPMAG